MKHNEGACVEGELASLCFLPVQYETNSGELALNMNPKESNSLLLQKQNSFLQDSDWGPGHQIWIWIQQVKNKRLASSPSET